MKTVRLVHESPQSVFRLSVSFNIHFAVRYVNILRATVTNADALLVCFIISIDRHHHLLRKLVLPTRRAVLFTVRNATVVVFIVHAAVPVHDAFQLSSVQQYELGYYFVPL